MQAATIFAFKDEFYEINLCQQGNLSMAGSEERAKNDPLIKNYKDVVLPNEPYELDFIMSPAAKIRGKLTDEKGKPIANQKLWIHMGMAY